MSIERIAALLERSGGPEKNFPPTDLYNEGWMLRLVLDWLSSNSGIDHDLAFATTDKWYSEALLPSAFPPRVRGDKLAESWTHADGVIGDFVIGADREGDLSLAEGGLRILVTEAKMFSKLSSGVKNASYFNQAARNVACIAEVICRAKISPNSLEKIGFFVIAPESQINDGVFAEHMALESIRSIVSRRVSEYQEPKKDRWLEDWFIPTLEKIRIREIPWEELCSLINQYDSAFGAQLDVFYGKCLEFNRYVANRVAF
jgi:hypothetical protein